MMVETAPSMEATDRWKDPSTVIPNAQLLGGVILGMVHTVVVVSISS